VFINTRSGTRRHVYCAITKGATGCVRLRNWHRETPMLISSIGCTDKSLPQSASISSKFLSKIWTPTIRYLSRKCGHPLFASSTADVHNCCSLKLRTSGVFSDICTIRCPKIGENKGVHDRPWKMWVSIIVHVRSAWLQRWVSLFTFSVKNLGVHIQKNCEWFLIWKCKEAKSFCSN